MRPATQVKALRQIARRKPRLKLDDPPGRKLSRPKIVSREKRKGEGGEEKKKQACHQRSGEVETPGRKEGLPEKLAKQLLPAGE